jgi:hypothetical protein
MHWRCVSYVALLVCLVSGCNRSPYELAPVSGLVTIDGHPLSDAKVMFAPIARGNNRDSGKPAFGQLVTDGSFTLTTYNEGDGAIVGEHWVTIIRTNEKREVTSTPVTNSPSSIPQFDRMAVPRKVNILANQENHIDLRLTNEEIRKFGIVDDD